MKKLFVLCTIFLALSAKSQTLDEWFNQKKTKLEYIAEQITAFQVYAGYLKQGYDIVEEGWSMVDDIKHGDFDLHNHYFNSLKEVKRAIADYGKVDDITNLQVQILQVNVAIEKLIADNEYIQSQEKEYIEKVMSNFLNKCYENLDQLSLLTTDGNAEMKDNERIQRIDDLYGDMQDKYAFARHFANSVQVLALSRAKDSNDGKTLQLLYGIK